MTPKQMTLTSQHQEPDAFHPQQVFQEPDCSELLDVVAGLGATFHELYFSFWQDLPLLQPDVHEGLIITAKQNSNTVVKP